jgi:hypothetical protein
LAEATNYDETNAVAYPGQIIAVFDNNRMQAFVLTENEQDNKLILSPIGIIPTGQGAISVSENGVITLGVDNGTIEIVDNVLTLKGFNSAINGAKLTKTENGLEWIAEDNSSVNLDSFN